MKKYQSNYRAIFGLMPYALAVVIILAGVKECKGQTDSLTTAQVKRIDELEKRLYYFVNERQSGKAMEIVGIAVAGIGSLIGSKKDNPDLTRDTLIAGSAIFAVGFIFDFKAGFKLKRTK